MTDWWTGKAWTQDVHERINATNYPGTRQICVLCDSPTGRCEEDEMYNGDIGPVCEDCWIVDV